MRIEIIGREGFVPNKRQKAYVEKRLAKVVDIFGPNVISEIRVVCKQYKDHYKIEVTIPAKRTILRAEVQDKDMLTAVDKVTDKLVAQIRKYKDKLKNNLEKEGIKQAYSKAFDEEIFERTTLSSQLVKNKKIKLDPMTTEEAITEMELLGHDFYVFLEKETMKTNVIYRRYDGNYAVIETEN